jgi:hypothetical protein
MIEIGDGEEGLSCVALAPRRAFAVYMLRE